MKRLVLVSSLVCGTLGAFAATCTYTEDNGWGDNPPTSSDDAIIISSGALTWDSSLPAKVASWSQTGGVVTFDTGLSEFEVAGNVTLDGGTWTHTENPKFSSGTTELTSGRGSKQLIVKVGGAMTIAAGATIDVMGKGYYWGQGPGATGSCGSAHGGAGAAEKSVDLTKSSGRCYGSVKQPQTLGSGGNSTSNGSRGGGAVKLTVAGALTLGGSIIADASDKNSAGNKPSYYAGSGGSVWVTAAEIIGAGTISAKGGPVTNNGGGGAGRVALYLTGDGKSFGSYTGDVDLSYTVKALSPFPGTLYREVKADGGKGELIVKGYNSNNIPLYLMCEGRLGTALNENGTLSVKKLTLAGRAQLNILAGTTLEVDYIDSTNDGNWINRIALVGGNLKLPDGYAPENCIIAISSAASRLEYASSTETVRVGNGCELRVNIPYTLNGDLSVASGGLVSHETIESGYDFGLDLTIPGDCAIAAGGKIGAIGRGYVNGRGQGVSSNSKTGASHGGRGNGGINKTGDADVGGNGPCYGSITQPITAGSGGNYSGAYGGGRIKLNVAGTTTVDGEINANAGDVDHYSGAGGSVWLSTTKLTGAGTICANGGYVRSGESNGTGGGGRVAVNLTGAGNDFTDYTGKITAYGGTKAGKVYGGVGTVYLETVADGAKGGKLIIDNGPAAQYKNFEARIGSLVTDTTVGSVEIAANSHLKILADQTLTFTKSWNKAATGIFTAEADSTVACDPVGDTATIAGDSIFYNFTAIAPGKTITFSVVDTVFQVAPNGKLTLKGDATSKLTLKSSSAGTQWMAKVDATTDMKDMECLHVVDGGKTEDSVKLEATKSDGENSDGWNFVSDIKPGEILTWTGAAGDGVFLNSENWEYGEEGAKQHRAPAVTDNLVIKASESDPTLSAELNAWSLTVQSGASINLAGFNVNVKNLTVAGTLVANGAETLTASENVSFAGGTFDAKHTKLLFTGANDQTFTPGSVTFANLLVEKDAGSITFADGFTADVFKITASGMMTALFAAGKTVTAREIRFDGLVNLVVSLTLKGVGDGAWSVNATSYSYARGVAVLNSTATGKPFDAIASSGTGCKGWTFNADAFVWKGGGADSEFYNADNWENGQVPTASSKVVIDSAATITSTEPVKVAGLLLGGGDATVSFTLSATLTVSGNLEVSDNATLVANQTINVGGSAYVRDGGVITHGTNAKTQVNTLTMNVTGEMVIDVGGAINVVGKGHDGVAGLGSQGISCSGPSHGGRGSGESGMFKNAKCYGSVFEPVSIGSSCHDNTYGSAAGGAVKLTVGGVLTVNGEINASGVDANSSFYSGAGGSIWVNTGSANGNGTIVARGGSALERGMGGGGRIAIYLVNADAPASTLTISAAGGHVGRKTAEDQEPVAGCGTIYLQGRGVENKAGVVLFDGRRSADYSSTGYQTVCDIPVTVDGEAVSAFVNTTLAFGGYSMTSLTGDLTVREIESFGKATLYLNNHTLTVMSNKHKKMRGLENLTVVTGGDDGKIVFVKPGIMLIAR